MIPTPYVTEERLPIVFDLDGTLAESVYPEPHIGKAIPEMVKLVHYFAAHDREIIIHTARPEGHRETIWRWLRVHGLENAVYDVVCGKPRGSLYIDDRSWNPLTDQKADLEIFETDVEQLKKDFEEQDESWIERMLRAING